MSERYKQITKEIGRQLEILKFIFSIVISILIAGLGYLITNKLEAIEEQLSKLNAAVNKQMVINNTLELKIDDHEKRIGELEE